MIRPVLSNSGSLRALDRSPGWTNQASSSCSPGSTWGRKPWREAMRMADAFDIKTRFMRSVNLRRDFRDETALEGYVLTPHVRATLERLAGGLAPRSGQRAWRITGDYGTGKSS